MEMYVLQIKPGCEQSSAALLRERGYAACCPLKEMQIHQGGKWHKRVSLIFTQYVFVECELNDVDYYNIKSVVGVVRFLGCGKPEAISDSEKKYIKLLCNGGKPIEASTVYTTVTGEKMIMSGILRKNTNNIISLDLRQRKAKVAVMLHGRKYTITVPVVGI